MLELTLVAFMVGGIFLVHWVTTVTLPPSLVTQIGLSMLAIGILEGFPTGLYYHVVLYRILHPRGKLPSGWWMSPQQYHVHLTEDEGRRIRRWFVLGGIGFVLCLIGGVMAILGMLPKLMGS